MATRARVVIEGIAPFVAAGFVFGLLYNTLFYPRTLFEYLEAGTIGVLLGTMAGLAEQAVLKQWFQRRSFIQAVAARTLAYSVAVALVLSAVLSVEPASLGQCAYSACLAEYVNGPLFVRDLGFSTAFVFFAAFSAQVVLLIGTRNFARLMLGRYRKPREIHATFMFVDIRSSTTIAEAWGHERYSAFLRDFFNDVSGAIHRAKGEIYQYVGDEVVIVWPGQRAPADWISCFNEMRGAIASERSVYEARYGVVPEFKAGVHLGPVVVTEIGTLQRAHVYHGDVLNTAARIQAKCNDTGFDLLASEAAMASAHTEHQGRFELVGDLPLRGRAETVAVFGFVDSRVEAGSA